MSKPVFIVIHAAFILVMILTVSRLVFVPGFILHQPFGIHETQSTQKIQDFASIINFVKSAWKRDGNSENSSVYSVENHLKFTENWAGKNIGKALPFGYSPTMVWIMAPFGFLPESTIYCLFVILGFIAVWWQTHPARCFWGLGVIPYFSNVAIIAFILGQTAILTGFLLLYARESSKAENSAKDVKTIITAAVAIWALTAKPPLAVVAFAAFIALRQWRTIGFAIMLTIASTLIISPLLGNGWWLDYLKMVTNYDTISAPSSFAWSLHPQLMATLRGVLSVDVGVPDDVAGKISSGIWLIVLSALVFAGPLSKLSNGGIWSLALLSYLAFCPHVSATEEIQITLLIPLCVAPNLKQLSSREIIIIVAVLLSCFISPGGNDLLVHNRWCLFMLKVFLMLFIAVNYRKVDFDYKVKEP